MLLALSQEELDTQLRGWSFDPNIKGLLQELMRISYGGGIVERYYHDNDSPTFARLFRFSYEKNVDKKCGLLNLGPEEEKLAFDVALFAYTKGFHSPGEYDIPSCIKDLSELLE